MVVVAVVVVRSGCCVALKQGLVWACQSSGWLGLIRGGRERRGGHYLFAIGARRRQTALGQSPPSGQGGTFVCRIILVPTEWTLLEDALAAMWRTTAAASRATFALPTPDCGYIASGQRAM